MMPVESIDFEYEMINLNSAWRKFEEIELMQSTGLKDKNSVEIFEGDVVKISDGGNEEDSYTSVVKNYADEGYPAFDIGAPSSWHYESNVLSTIMGGRLRDNRSYRQHLREPRTIGASQ